MGASRLVPRGKPAGVDCVCQGGAVLVAPVWCVFPLWVCALVPLLVGSPFPSVVVSALSIFRCSWLLVGSLLLWCVAPGAPVPVGVCPSPCALPHPFAAGLPFALSLAGALVVGWWWGLGGADGPCLRLGGLEPPAEGFGAVGGAEALNRVTEERFP